MIGKDGSFARSSRLYSRRPEYLRRGKAPDTIGTNALPCCIYVAIIADEVSIRTDRALEKERGLPRNGKKDMPGHIEHTGKRSLHMRFAEGTADLVVVLLDVCEGNGYGHV